MSANKPSSTAVTTATEPAWYRQFWPWFVFGLPAAAVAASLLTLLIAIAHRDTVVEHAAERPPADIRSGALEPVPDNEAP